MNINKYNINDYVIKLDKLGKIIIYLRKSREDMIDGRYASDEETLSRHEEQLQQWALNNLGYEIPPENIYKEVVSGEKIDKRPVFKEVLRLVETETVDAVLCVNPSRLSRGDLVDCGVLINTFEVTNTLILTPPKIYNLKDRYDKRFFKDELLRGNDYLEQTKELLQNGRHWSTAQGKFVGSVAPYGYDRVTCKEMNLADGKGYTLKPNYKAEYVKLMFDMYLDGNGCHKIATHLNNINAPMIDEEKWERCKVQRILQNTTYCGILTYGELKNVKKMKDGETIIVRVKDANCPKYKGLHTPIVTEEEFKAVQDRLCRGESPTRKGEETKNPVTGIAKCAVCGRAMVRHVDGRPYAPKRKHALNEEELLQFLNEHKKALKLSAKTLSAMLDVKQHYCHDWFGKNIDRFHPNSKLFVSKWYEIKKALNITTDKYDAAVTEFINPEKPDVLTCSGHNCSNVQTFIYKFEEKLIEHIKERFNDYKYFVDNYAVEITKKIAAAKENAKDVEKEIALKEKQLKNAKIAYEQGADTLQEYIDRKKELLTEIEVLTEKKNKITNVDEEEKTITIKKAVPILKNVFECYHELTAAEKNALLRTIIDTVEYDRKDGKEITLDICWLV